MTLFKHVVYNPAGKVQSVYRFDYSEEGVGRHTGHVIMLGSRLEQLSMGLPDE